MFLVSPSFLVHMFENYVSFWILQILFGVNLVVLYTAQLSSFLLCFIHMVGAEGQTDGYEILYYAFRMRTRIKWIVLLHLA
jgi:hypothetical protein